LSKSQKESCVDMPEVEHPAKKEITTRQNQGQNGVNSLDGAESSTSVMSFADGIASGLKPNQNAILRMQTRQGNAAVMRMLTAQGYLQARSLQRDTTPNVPDQDQDRDGVATAIDYDPRSWPTALANTTRKAGKHITAVKGDDSLNIPDMPDIPLTETQQAIVDAIARNRSDLPAALDKLALVPYKKVANAGYYYDGKDGKGMQGAGGGGGGGGGKRQQVIDAVRAEIGREGSSSAVNTYDDAVVTLGKGFTRALLAKVMQSFFQKDAEAKNLFLDIGVTWENNIARVVNTDTGGIEEGDDALQLIRFEPEILSQFVALAESKEHGPTLAAVQDQTIMGTAGQVPQSVVDGWSDMMAIRLVAHLIHFRSSKTWGDYAGTGGNVKAIMGIFLSVLGKSSDPVHGGALYVTPEQTSVVFSFAGGKGKQALDSQSPKAFPDPIAPDSLAGHAVFDAGGGSYYDMTL
jgi:hypothetical protein